jgi:hypothetical protein
MHVRGIHPFELRQVTGNALYEGHRGFRPSVYV